MVGLQGAGKTTWVAGHLAGGHAVVSKDHWPRARRRQARQQRVGRGAARRRTQRRRGQHQRLARGRAALVAAARAAGVPVRAVWVDTPPEVSGERNAARLEADRVPLVGVPATRRRFRPPTAAEGFDRVDVVRPGW